MKLLKLVFGVAGTLFFTASLNAATPQNSTKLPVLEELERLKFSPMASTDASGLPSSSDLESALNSFQFFHQGSGWKWQKERGVKDTRVYNQAINAVVFIQEDLGEQNEKGVPQSSYGAGVILVPDDLILTAMHVVRVAEDRQLPILVYLKPLQSPEPIDSLAYKATVEYKWPEKDLAVLRFVQHPPYQLAKLKIGNMSDLTVGLDIHVIGHPGVTNYWSLSTGIISQIRPGFKTSGINAGTDSRPIMQALQADMLQLQTAISGGNSGGPVLDDNANIVGIVSFHDPKLQNVNYAIAADEIVSFMQQRDRWAASKSSVKPPAVKPSYFRARSQDGSEVIKLQYPDHAQYLIRGTDGKLKGLIANVHGTVIRAWKPIPDGGFAEWTAQFADGSTAEGSGTGGFPTSFQAKK